MNLPTLEKVKVSGKKVIIRLDLDVDEDYSRLELAEETLDFLIRNMAKVIIIGHKGRPSFAKATEGKPEEKIRQEFSLAPLASVLGGVVGEKVNFVGDIIGAKAHKEAQKLPDGELILLENLRFDSGEEQNDERFSKSLAELGEIFVNEAFAVSHRPHTSIVGVPKYLPHAAGFRFTQEVENLNKIIVNPKRPLVVIISGIKEDKVEMAKSLTQIADKVLVGGKLPKYFADTNPNPEKLVLADLTFDGFDISLNSAGRFKAEIAKAGTIVLAGVLGKYEEEDYRQGTKEVFRAVSQASAYKVAGGGDTEATLTMLGLTSKFDWISVGGGAMLEFLAKGTLPGIEALLS